MSLPDHFLLSYVGFSSGNQPIIDTQVENTIARHHLEGEQFYVQFDMSKRHCSGWVNFEARTHEPCPDQALVDPSYEQCMRCRNATGFNPAFYHASTISKQQEEINQRPHFVYLASFGPGIIKVGISQQSRGIRRILEQGARAAITLETFPTATIARQYEARIAALPGVVEHVTYARKSNALIKTPFDESTAIDELVSMQRAIELQLNLTLDKIELVRPNAMYGISEIRLNDITIVHDIPVIIGTYRAMVGSTLIVEHNERLLAYNLKSFIGRMATPATEDQLASLPSEQMSLF